MRVGNLMTRSVISLAPDDTVARARWHFRSHNIHHLLVLEGRKVVGIVTFEQLRGRSDLDLVRDFMVKNVVSVDSETTLRRAASLMIGGRTGCLPVVDQGELRGIITTTDLRRAVSNGDQTLR